jgi:hypothetical protein
MLPVYLDRTPAAAAPGDAYRYELTREGWLQPWVRLRSTEQEERVRLESLPGFQVLNRLREVKPGASVLAVVRDNRGNQFPAIAVQRFGNGRSAVIAIGDLWRGSLQNEKAKADVAKSWRQMLRWLIADVPRQLELHAQPSASGETGITLEARVRDRNFAPVDNANVAITVFAPSARGSTLTNGVNVAAGASDKEPGAYRATYVPRESGGYLAKAVFHDSAGLRLGEAEAGWVSEPLAKEFASLSPNRQLLQEIAKKTGGQMVPLSDLEDFVGSLGKKKAPVVETYSYPLWHTPAVFLLVLACFISEWGIRRMKGLA